MSLGGALGLSVIPVEPQIRVIIRGRVGPRLRCSSLCGVRVQRVEGCGEAHSVPGVSGCGRIAPPPRGVPVSAGKRAIRRSPRVAFVRIINVVPTTRRTRRTIPHKEAHRLVWCDRVGHVGELQSPALLWGPKEATYPPPFNSTFPVRRMTMEWRAWL